MPRRPPISAISASGARTRGDGSVKRCYYENLSYADILNVTCIGHRFQYTVNESGQDPLFEYNHTGSHGPYAHSHPWIYLEVLVVSRSRVDRGLRSNL